MQRPAFPWIAVAVTAAGAGLLLHFLLPVLIPFALAFAAAYVLNPLVAAAQVRGFRRRTIVVIGYIAEALYDFGFPWMLLPIFGIGMGLGFIAIFYLTRPVPATIREAFMCANLFLSFNFGQNIDKALGVFLIGLLVLSLLLKFGFLTGISIAVTYALCSVLFRKLPLLKEIL